MDTPRESPYVPPPAPRRSRLWLDLLALALIAAGVVTIVVVLALVSPLLSAGFSGVCAIGVGVGVGLSDTTGKESHR